MQSCARKCIKSLTVTLLLTLVMLMESPLTLFADGTMDEDSVFVSIRVYYGLEPNDTGELYRRAAEGFLNIIGESEGFIGFYWLHSGENVTTISLFATEAQASASNETARDYVAEHLAGLVPNPPIIVEGAVDIGFVDMLNGTGDNQFNSLHASVRVYDGFEASGLEEFVTILEDGFLPLMRETDGFFGYYLMHDDAGMVSVISIFDTEASALASNEKTRDFVANNLTAFLPSSPSIVSGRVGVAALAGVNDGANLIDEMTEGSDFVSIRVYGGVDPADHGEIVRIIDDGFLQIMRESEGFVGYYLLPAGDVLATISLFDSAEQAAASTAAARDFVAEHLAPFLPSAPLIVEGMVDVMYLAGADEMVDDSMTALYAALRIYDNYDLSHLDEANEVVETILLPAQQKAGGLFSYFAMNDGIDLVAGLSIYDSEESALAANEIAVAIVEEHMADWLPDDPVRVNGRLGVAAVMALHEGLNLAEWMDEG